jgi:PleD family two-component response regulator
MSAPGGRRSVVLIVDDAVENIAALGAALRADYEVQFATSGEQAIELATARPGPDIVLLDVVMPGMDGFTVCRTLKDDERTRFIPIVIMTSLDDADDRVRGIEAGADDFLTKPVDQRQLRARIRTALRAKHSLDEKIRSFQQSAVPTVLSAVPGAAPARPPAQTTGVPLREPVTAPASGPPSPTSPSPPAR